ncbi:MAG TPA: TfuA-like protein [Micromonosporaceae bacterium]
MNARQVVVYAGPTISPDEVHAVLPDAEVRPPVARGDLLEGQWRRGDTAVLVDGFFRERRSVGHKEILWLLGEGVDVVGTASMGALRAAELAPYGMRGLGGVYDMYATGEIDGDDEVGVLHGPAAVGYPAQTVALVNLRYGVREGVRAGLFPAATGTRIVEAAKALAFTCRSWSDLEQAVDDDDRDALRTLERTIRDGDWDLKRLDAIAALREVAAGGEAQSHPASDVIFTGISRNQLLDRRSRREYAPGRWMSDLDVLDAARLFDEDYPEWHEQALTGLLTDLAAAEGLDLAGFVHTKLGVDAGEALPDSLASWLTEPERERLSLTDALRLVMVRVWPVWQSVDWRPAVLARLRDSHRWQDWCDIVADAHEAADQTRYRLVVPPPAICARMFLRHWPGGSPEIEMARRGFSSPEELGITVSRFFAYDVQRGRRQAAAR